MTEHVVLKLHDSRAAPDIAHEVRLPFRAEFVTGRLVGVTRRCLEIESEDQVQAIQHGLEYTELLALVDRYGGKTIVLHVINKHIKKLSYP